MCENKKKCHADNTCAAYSSITPATGTDPNNKPLADSLANAMPTADSPALDGSKRADPDKTIPGPEAATGVDEAEESLTKKGERPLRQQ